MLTPNLICAAGHEHYSPRPSSFRGRECFHSDTRNQDGSLPVRTRCREKLSYVSKGPATIARP